MKKDQDDYSAFLLRLWREEDGSVRATMQDPHSGKRYVFASQKDLMRFMTSELLPNRTDCGQENER